MFQVKCRTQNVSFKVCHSKCLKKVSFKISQKMSLKVKKKKHLVGISLTSQYSRQKGFPIYHLSEGAKSLFSR